MAKEFKIDKTWKKTLIWVAMISAAFDILAFVFVAIYYAYIVIF